MTRQLALFSLIAALCACNAQPQPTAQLENDHAEWESLVSAKTMAKVSNRHLIHMR